MNGKRILAGSAVLVVGALALSACAGGGGDSGSGDGDVTMTFWHNSTTGPGKAYWDDTVAAFEEANPGVTIEMQSVQNEEMDGKLQTALNSGDAPDIFMARGGGKLADVVAAGQAMDLTSGITDATESALGGVLSAFEVDGKVYGVPTAVLPSGIFYSGDAFEAAGVTRSGHDRRARGRRRGAQGDRHRADRRRREGCMAGRALVLQLRAARLREGDDGRSGREPRVQRPVLARSRREPAGVPRRPSRSTTGFLTTAAQQGAGSSAGLVANRQAAMELMGAWDPGVIASLTPDEKPLPDLLWFPFPEVDGGAGEPGRDDGRRRRVLLLGQRSGGVRRLPQLHGREGEPGGVRRGVRDPSRLAGGPGSRHRPGPPGDPRRRTTRHRTSRCGSTPSTARTSATR